MRIFFTDGEIRFLKGGRENMRKEMRPGRKYFIINIDEPYAEKIYEVLKIGQMEKGEWPEGDIDFDEWKRQTFSEIDWTKAEQHLQTTENAYAEIGSPGYWTLSLVVRPLRDRFNRGERTQELYDEIMGIELWKGAIAYIAKHWDAIKQVWQQAKAEAQAEMEQKAEEKRKARLMAGTLWTYDRKGKRKYTA
jgi:hypothetical protein